jgi:tyrosyl-DNA phosphodiesterase-1
METQGDAHPVKRRKLDANLPERVLASTESQNRDAPHKGLDRPISPPPARRKSPIVANLLLTPTWGFDDLPRQISASASPSAAIEAERDTARERGDRGKRSSNYARSPIQLTHVEDLALHQNVSAMRLRDILGDPMIKECWNFNFLFDIDFVM